MQTELSYFCNIIIAIYCLKYTCRSVVGLAYDFEIAIHVGELVHLLKFRRSRSTITPETCNVELITSVNLLINRDYVLKSMNNMRIRAIFLLEIFLL